MRHLCMVDAVQSGQPLKVALDGGRAVAVFKVAGAVYVIDDLCTHGQASLSEDGDLDGYTITCSWHDGAFDIRTGAVVARPCTEPVRSYPVTLRDGGVFIAAEAPGD